MRINLNTYSLRKEWKFFSKNNYAALFKMADMIGTKELELLEQHFNPNTLKSLQELIVSHGLKVFSLGCHPCFLTNPPNWEKRISEGKKWVDICADLGIPYYRISIGGGKYEPSDQTPKSVDEAVEWAVKVFEPVINYAEKRNVTPCIETHHKYSSNPEWQLKLLEKVPSKNLGFIYDIGNYENDTLRWVALDVLIKKRAVKYMHAKSYNYNAQGFETKLDYPRAIKALYDAQFDIPLSIEWEGHLLGPLGVLKTNELCKYSIAKATNQQYTMKTQFPNRSGLKKLLQ